MALQRRARGKEAGNRGGRGGGGGRTRRGDAREKERYRRVVRAWRGAALARRQFRRHARDGRGCGGDGGVCPRTGLTGKDREPGVDAKCVGEI
jgi:hypothetical protein